MPSHLLKSFLSTSCPSQTILFFLLQCIPGYPIIFDAVRKRIGVLFRFLSCFSQCRGWNPGPCVFAPQLFYGRATPSDLVFNATS